ncbi:MAG: aspartyl-tRNA(Asn)/glutamyl-tRNA(Gln) amidotransferase subunit [Thermoproteota archaeon]|nr:aspartyl-tRNA(Asn)/glutamyl-tRNA(Gln) amidotransferase subunit [Thermoproteota archaeon]
MKSSYNLSAKEIVTKISRGESSAEECLSSFFERIDEVESRVHAFITLDRDAALQRAKEIDGKVKRKERLGKLVGVPVAIKDNLCTRDVRTTCSSKMLENFLPPYNAHVVEQLLKEDAIILGKTNMDEFAMGSSTESSYFGTTKNPWNLAYVPGGSSGGSAAAVSARESSIALGSDTGGSVRCPASFCSTVGLKPTYGLVSRFGLIAYANSLEQIGPLARSVDDLALLFEVISGYDQRDSTSIRASTQNYSEFLREDVDGLKIGVPEEFFGEGVDERIVKIVWKGIDCLEKLGASYSEFSLSTVKYALPAYYLIATSEASSNLARYDGLRYGYSSEVGSDDWSTTFSNNRKKGFGAEVRRRILLGTFALSAGYYDQYYLKSLQVRTKIRLEFEKAFKKFDVLAGPTMPILPFKIGEKIDDLLALYMCDILTVLANLVGCPAISIPCGFVDSLPIGMQIMGPMLGESVLFRTAYTFEKCSKFTDYSPKL